MIARESNAVQHDRLLKRHGFVCLESRPRRCSEQGTPTAAWAIAVWAI